MPTVHPTVWDGRAIAEPFKMRCTNEDFPTPEKEKNQNNAYNWIAKSSIVVLKITQSYCSWYSWQISRGTLSFSILCTNY
jgi:hypothetical protein